MYQLEFVFQLLVPLQFMYFQYNVYLSIVVCTNVIGNNLKTPQLVGLAHQLGCKNTKWENVKSYKINGDEKMQQIYNKLKHMNRTRFVVRNSCIYLWPTMGMYK